MTCRQARTGIQGLLILSVATLQSCANMPLDGTGPVTGWLWGESNSTPKLARSSAVCEVQAVRGAFLSARPDEIAVEVDFSLERDLQTPSELGRYTGRERGSLRITPRAGERTWLASPGANLFQPESWSLEVFHGSYFRDRSPNVGLVFAGRLEPNQVGALLRADQLRDEWRGLPVMAPPQTDDLLEVFKSHDWEHLITGATHYTERDALPVAWLNSAGRVVSADEIEAALEAAETGATDGEDLLDYTLLGRLDSGWGTPLFVRIPFSILAQAGEMKLSHLGGEVLWERPQVWKADVVPAGSAAAGDNLLDRSLRFLTSLSEIETTGNLGGALPVESIPLGPTQFVYTSASTYVPSQSLVTRLAKIVATPVAVLVDVLVVSSPFYRALADWLDGGDRTWAGPVGPRK